MDLIVNTVASYADGRACAIVNCYEPTEVNEVASSALHELPNDRRGCRAVSVHGNIDEILGLPVRFVMCDSCKAVTASLGTTRKSTQVVFSKDDPCARLLSTILDPANANWDRPNEKPCRMVGIVSVYGSQLLSRYGGTCVLCKA
ncbi:unknown [Feldmannia species virus]|uniref:Uncharacterized protein n=1 Tax=Feldmannia species virus TaxID=39420 RepID=B5LWI4_9PHYC|nr:hypothetical protein FeldSpV_gp095 [Feldmannia species virus]ACH46847.1 unknown [Feldmannia species virus]